jgi:hypothetical protein
MAAYGEKPMAIDTGDPDKRFCKPEVVGSIPSGSITDMRLATGVSALD